MPIWLKEWWPVIAFLSSILLPAIVWAVRTGLASKADLAGEKAARERALSDVEGRLAGGLEKLSSRVGAVEQEVRHLPTAEDFSDLRNEVTRVGTLVVASAKETESIGRAITRVEDHLLKRPS